jgi:hypothetical protein
MPLASLRKQARILMWLVTIPFAGLSLLTVLLLGNIIWQGGRYADAVAIYYLPMFLYMWAILMVRRALKAISDGALFDQVVPKLLFRVGIALFGGALFTVIGQPLVWALLYDVPDSRTFEPSPVTLAVIGAALVLFSKLLKRAASLREELDEFF